jgi:hypothetical protein
VTLLKKPISRRTESRVSHAIAPLVITLYPGGIIGIREVRRRKEVVFDAGTLYLQAVAREVDGRRKRKR